jgi:hypothetical protein
VTFRQTQGDLNVQREIFPENSSGDISPTISKESFCQVKRNTILNSELKISCALDTGVFARLRAVAKKERRPATSGS